MTTTNLDVKNFIWYSLVFKHIFFAFIGWLLYVKVNYNLFHYYYQSDLPYFLDL